MAPATTSAAASRVAVRYHDTQKDMVLASRTPIGDLIAEIVDSLRENTTIEEPRNGQWTLARPDGPLKPQQTLAEARVPDGAILDLRAVSSTERYRPVIEDVIDAVAEAAAEASKPFDAQAARRAGLAGLIAGGLALCAAQWILWISNDYAWPWMVVGIVGALAALVGMTSAARRYQASDAATAWSVIWVAAAAVAGQAIPVSAITGRPGVAHLLIAAVGVCVATLSALLITRNHLAVYSCVAAMSASLAVVCAIVEYTALPPSAIAAAVLLVGLVAVLEFVPRTALSLARISLPPVPAPGQDDVEVGGEVTGAELQALRIRSQRAVQLSSGLLVAAVAVVVGAAIWTLDPDSYYARVQIAIMVCVVIVLTIKGRTMSNRIQAYAMFAGAAVVLISSAAKLLIAWPHGWAPIIVLTVVVAAITALVLVAIVVAPRSVNPLVGRWVDWLGNAALIAVFPLGVWVTGVFAQIREIVF